MDGQLTHRLHCQGPQAIGLLQVCVILSANIFRTLFGGGEGEEDEYEAEAEEEAEEGGGGRRGGRKILTCMSEPMKYGFAAVVGVVLCSREANTSGDRGVLSLQAISRTCMQPESDLIPP